MSSYQNEFDNLNTMMLEDYPLRMDEVDQVDPTEFRERVAKLINKAKSRLSFAGITKQERLGLMKIASGGLEAMAFQSHQALTEFYKNIYMVEINKATQSDYFVANDFDYVGDDEKDVLIHEQEINEKIDQFSAFDPAFNFPSFSANNGKGMGSLSEVESIWGKSSTYVAIAAAVAGYYYFKSKRSKR